MIRKIRVLLIILIFIFSNTPFVVSCTVFHASNENVAFGGNNEDWNDPDTYIYFIPSDNNRYGRVIVGYTGSYWIQGGMNEKGLFWDGLAAPYLEVHNSANKPYFNGHIFDYILSTCDNCQEAIDILNQYNMKILERAQILIGDKYGDSFIIEGDVIHHKSDYFQISTNFYLSKHPDPPYPCWRYSTALKMFQNNNMMNLSIDFCTSVLDAVHQEGTYSTQYSTIYDLKNGLIYLYHNYDYNRVKCFNLSKELKLGYHSYSIPEIFEQINQPPNKPNKPIGISKGKIGEKYFFKTSAIDLDGDEIYYLYDWGDNTYSDWLGPFYSGEICNISHIWSEGGYFDIKVKAKDLEDMESDWSDPLAISIPKDKSNNIQYILEEFYYFFLDFIDNYYCGYYSSYYNNSKSL